MANFHAAGQMDEVSSWAIVRKVTGVGLYGPWVDYDVVYDPNPALACDPLTFGSRDEAETAMRRLGLTDCEVRRVRGMKWALS